MPQVIILGSLAQYFGIEWVENVTDIWQKERLCRPGLRTRIVMPGLDDSIQDLSSIAPVL
jgi:hypothetical protein